MFLKQDGTFLTEHSEKQYEVFFKLCSDTWKLNQTFEEVWLMSAIDFFELQENESVGGLQGIKVNSALEFKSIPVSRRSYSVGSVLSWSYASRNLVAFWLTKAVFMLFTVFTSVLIFFRILLFGELGIKRISESANYSIKGNSQPLLMMSLCRS